MSRWIHVAAAVVLLVGALLHLAAGYSGGTDTSEHALGTDDAYITYRYAQNLVAGHGLVFNPGERVEGYTNLGFVLLSAVLLLAVGGEHLYWGVAVLNLALLLLLFAAFVGHARERLGRRRAGAAAGLLATCPALWLWTASGMETVLVAALQVGVWIAVERLEEDDGRHGVALLAALLGLGAVVRADGFLWIAVAVAYLALRGQGRKALHAGLSSASVVALLFAGRLVYYAELWPNTYYAKVAEPLATRWQRGAAQLYELAMSQGLLPYLLVLLFVLIRPIARAAAGGRGRRRPFLAAASFPSFFSACLVLYWIHVGGDHFEERFLLALFPLGIVTFLRLFSDLGGGRLAMLATLLVVLQTRPLFADPRFAYEAGRYDCWVTLGEFLAEQPDDTVLAVDAAGKIPYFSGLRTIDMLGLADRHIARGETRGGEEAGHNKADPRYVLDRRPDLIAAWVTPSLDLAAGLDRRLYRQAGYRLTWMLNTSKRSREWNVLDVSAATDPQIFELIRRGYRYGVLSRAPEAGL